MPKLAHPASFHVKLTQRRSFLIMVLSILTLSGCNFPLKVLWYTPRPTLDPAIFETHATPQFSQQTPENPTLPSGQEIFPYDPNVSISYISQSGDTLTAVAKHFGVTPDQITSPQSLPQTGLLPPGQQLILPRGQDPVPFADVLMPDSAVINSSCGREFDISAAIAQRGGYLDRYTQVVDDRTLTGAEVVKQVAENTSVNPMFLLALIEFRSGWVTTTPATLDLVHPLSLNTPHYEELYLELSLAAKLLNTGYYAWRQGQMTELVFAGRGSTRIAPNLNAGSVGLEYLFSQLFSQDTYNTALFGSQGFLQTYRNLFGDPFACASKVEPQFTADTQPPALELPFAPGEPWALTGGLHVDWNSGTPWGALDFAPITGEPPCVVSRAWVTASASGVVTRAESGALQLALTDQNQQFTGWEILYMHVAAQDRAAVGTIIHIDDRIGHPSCEGGAATGTHVHIARMYKGEWIGAGDPFPYVLSGWEALPGDRQFQSTLVKNGQVVSSRIDGTGTARIVR